MKFNLKNYSQNYWLIMLIFFGVFLLGQTITAYLWSHELKMIDIFQLVVAPACCYCLASLLGQYQNKKSALLSVIVIWLIGSLFYVLFQKVTFFNDSYLFSIFISNTKLFGLPIMMESILAIFISYCVLLKKDKNLTSV